jgi:tRNA threonylcarbamoyl adenosine modification protein YjeE
VTILLATRRTTAELAARVARGLSGGDLVILSGPLGSGKTFFARALAHALGLPKTERVTSPTFVLVQEYETAPRLVHADVYRLTRPEEVAALGLDEQRDHGRVVVVEWGESYIRLLGGDALVVDLAVDPRRATLRATGARSAEILRLLG